MQQFLRSCSKDRTCQLSCCAILCLSAFVSVALVIAQECHHGLLTIGGYNAGWQDFKDMTLLGIYGCPVHGPLPGSWGGGLFSLQALVMAETAISGLLPQGTFA